MKAECAVDCVVEWEETEDIPLLKLEATRVKRGQAIQYKLTYASMDQHHLMSPDLAYRNSIVKKKNCRVQ